MTERLADISDRIEGIRQLGAVVNAMKGIAAARAHVARTQLDAVDRYAATIAAGLSSLIASDSAKVCDKLTFNKGAQGLLVFCAEQGFAGAFSERVFDGIGDELNHATLFLIGTRGQSLAHARGITPHWAAALPSHTMGIPKLASTATAAIYRAVAENRIDGLDVVFTAWEPGHASLLRETLFPVKLADVPSTRRERPLTQIPDSTLLDILSQDYFHAQICRATLHAFAAENEARLLAMSAASSQIARELTSFKARLNRVRQEAITAEIIELGTGAAAAHDVR